MKYTIEIIEEGARRFRPVVTFADGRREALPTYTTHNEAFEEGIGYLRSEVMEPPYACPNCGEKGGTPETHYSSEFQGCAEHGGRVEWQEQGCSKCIRELSGGRAA